MRHARRLGQHFLVSPDILKKIIWAAGLSQNDTALEIGPGTGTLTRALARQSGMVVAVEKDAELYRALEAALNREKISNVRLVLGDILKTSFERLGLPPHYVVVANIPYYLTSRLIRRLLESEATPQRIFLMVQQEVALRMTARPPDMNLLALSVQAYGTPEVLFAVPPKAFSPPPKVDSAFIAIRDIRPFESRHGTPAEVFFRLARAAFQGKRKTIENSLSHNLGIPKKPLAKVLVTHDLAQKRPEELDIGDWVRLSKDLMAHFPESIQNSSPHSKK